MFNAPIYLRFIATNATDGANVRFVKPRGNLCYHFLFFAHLLAFL